MIVYLDTSALVKRYIFEQGSDQVHQEIGQANIVGTSLIAYPEALSAFSRNFHENVFDRRYYNRIRASFERDWQRIHVVDFTREIAHNAGRLIERYGLRGFDAVHLATALRLKSWLSAPVVFLCFDEKLFKAARAEGLNQRFTLP